jgi:putative membrane-bound dehydrogenase-like protein
MRYSLALVLALCSFNSAWALPKAPANWKVEVVAEQPVIKNPSVVCCAPDGRIFVAEDPMDMVGPPNEPGDRIMCLHPDGKWTVFAEKLYAVFGLYYLDGKLFVHHSPRFSVFDDGGTVGKNRVDLIDCTNPRPWAGMNDHIPSNFRLGMDGWFYMSTGDKGIYGAVGKDGSKAEIHGGGVMRFRPDGTHLEVFSTGSRNHLDVAINSEDEIFTYDNTDDGNGWWTRLTHMVDGGFYGYPYDYKPRRPYTLWMMADYGGGSPTGGLAYNEDALPEEYRGNLFMCEWGKKELVRFRVQRDGGSFKVESREAFLAKDTQEFRPVGIAISADGMSFYLADWNFGGWSNKTAKVGRLLKATYTGKSEAAPKPEWYVPAAMGKSFKATTAELIQAMRHPAQSVRLVAMRRIAERPAAETVAELEKLFQDAKAPAFARWSALWTLDRIDEGKASRSIIRAALKDSDVSVRRQAARQLGTRAVKEAVADLTKLLSEDNDRSVRFQAATALGHIGQPAAVDALLASLSETDLFTRYAEFNALNRIGRAQPEAWAKIVAGLNSDETRVREATLFAFRETYEPAALGALVKFATDSKISGERRSVAFPLLGDLTKKVPAWKGQWWNTQPVKAPPPAHTETWTGTNETLTALQLGLKDGDALVRQGAAQGMIAAHEPQLAMALIAYIPNEKDNQAKKVMLETLSQVRAPDEAFVKAANQLCADLLKTGTLIPETLAFAAKLGDATPELTEVAFKLTTVDLPADQLIALLETLSWSTDPRVVKILVEKMENKSAKVRARAVQLVTNRFNEDVYKALMKAFKDQDLTVRKEVVICLGKRKERDAMPELLALLSNKDLKFDAITALAQMPDPRAAGAYLEGIGGKNNKQRDESIRALSLVKKDAWPTVETRLKAKPALPAGVVLQLQKIYQNVPEAKDSSLFKLAVKEIRPEDFATASLKEKGNAERGRAIFLDAKGVACAKCHRVGKEGGEVGPDLSGIGLKYNRDQLIDNVLFPSKQILDGYDMHLVETKDGKLLSGIIRAENATDITMIDAEGKTHAVKIANLESRAKSPKSIMPEGSQTNLTVSEFADLISFLESLKEKMPAQQPPAKKQGAQAPRVPAPKPGFGMPTPGIAQRQSPTPTGLHREGTAFYRTIGSMLRVLG